MQLEGEDVKVVADVQTPIRFVCDRCGAEFTQNLNAKAEATYSEISDYETPSEVEMEYKIASNQINLTPLVRDAIIEGMPSQALCKKSCKGLCTRGITL